MSGEEKVILAIRVRGKVKVRPQIDDTLKKLRLGRLHQARILKLTPSIEGMIVKSKDYITWGEVDLDVIEKLIEKRGRFSGNRRVSDSDIKKNSTFTSIKSLAKAIASGDATTSDVEGLKPVFRLSPPKKGYRGKKTLPVGMGGETGYRGTGINELASRMI
jgi:large subunit ribosomal protein L30